MYEEGRKHLPMVGEEIEYEDTEWEVSDRNIPLQTVTIVRNENGEEQSRTIKGTEVKRIRPLQDSVLENKEQSASSCRSNRSHNEKNQQEDTSATDDID